MIDDLGPIHGLNQDVFINLGIVVYYPINKATRPEYIMEYIIVHSSLHMT